MKRLSDTLPGNGASGGFGTFHVVAYAPKDTGEFRAVFGDTRVAAIEFTPDGARARALLSYGNSSPNTLPRTGRQLELIADQAMRPVWRTRAEVEAHLERVTPISANMVEQTRQPVGRRR